MVAPPSPALIAGAFAAFSQRSQIDSEQRHKVPGGGKNKWLVSTQDQRHTFLPATVQRRLMPRPRQPDPPSPAPVWICPTCHTLMRVRTVEVANGEERTNLACMTCGCEATESIKLPDA